MSRLNLSQAYLLDTYNDGSNSGVVGVVEGPIHSIVDNSFGGYLKATGGNSTTGGILNRSKSTMTVAMTGNFSTGVIETDGAAGGILAGVYDANAQAPISDSYSSMSVVGNGALGGLVAGNIGRLQNVNISITRSHASGAVVGNGSTPAGGLVGCQQGEAGSNVNVSYSHASGPVRNGSDTGGLIGNLSCEFSTVLCNIDHSYAQGAVSVSIGGYKFAGGFIGAAGHSGTSVISDSYSTGTVTITGGIAAAGGFFGQYGTNNTYPAIPDTTIRDSYSTSNVVVPTSGGTGAGGFSGYVYSDWGGRITLDHVHATGSVTGGPRLGGLFGSFGFNGSGTTRVLDSYATGAVTGQYWVGGMAGSADLNNNAVLEITRSYVSGNVTGTDSVGGFIGLLSNGQSNATLNVNESYYTTGTVSAVQKVGGFIGSVNYDSVTNNTVNISKSYVTSSATLQISDYFVGGFIGQFSCIGTTSGSAINFSKVSSAATTTGDHSVGGIVGFARAVTGCTYSMTDSYVAGNITATGGYNLGGIIGESIQSGSGVISINRTYSRALFGSTGASGLINGTPRTIIDSYWLKDTGINTSTTTDANARTAAFLQNSTNLSSWVFSPTSGAPWTLSPGPFPSLQ
ncbi:MAG: hypothetical protein EOP84_16395 [Verrucomicrobiaceae bacterium]|nr:MAG: hypothetical protein EOP84_16395 [Verrucomicrobiaceae bacterium]